MHPLQTSAGFDWLGLHDFDRSLFWPVEPNWASRGAGEQGSRGAEEQRSRGGRVRELRGWCRARASYSRRAAAKSTGTTSTHSYEGDS